MHLGRGHQQAFTHRVCAQVGVCLERQSQRPIDLRPLRAFKVRSPTLKRIWHSTRSQGSSLRRMDECYAQGPCKGLCCLPIGAGTSWHGSPVGH